MVIRLRIVVTDQHIFEKIGVSSYFLYKTKHNNVTGRFKQLYMDVTLWGFLFFLFLHYSWKFFVYYVCEDPSTRITQKRHKNI